MMLSGEPSRGTLWSGCTLGGEGLWGECLLEGALLALVKEAEGAGVMDCARVVAAAGVLYVCMYVCMCVCVCVCVCVQRVQVCDIRSRFTTRSVGKNI